MAKVDCTCTHCSALFQIHLSSAKHRNGRLFCSRSCYLAILRIEQDEVHGPLTHERLKGLLHYDPETGAFTNLLWRGGTAHTGREAGAVSTKDGYRRISVDSRDYLAHRLAWFYMTGEWPKQMIDHKDGDRANNRFANLRDASRSVNMQNLRNAHSRNKLGILGVCLHQGLYVAQIRSQGENLRLGGFKTPEEAHGVYLEAKRRLHLGGDI